MPDHGTSGSDVLPRSERDRFLRREALVQRVGWAVLWAVLLAGFLGLFGAGPLARAEVGGDGWGVEYERFVRSRTPSGLSLRIATAADTVVVWIDRAYADRMDVGKVAPQPLSVAIGPERLIFRFLKSTGHPARIVFDVTPQQPGRIAGRLGVADSPPVVIRQFVYP